MMSLMHAGSAGGSNSIPASSKPPPGAAAAANQNPFVAGNQAAASGAAGNASSTIPSAAAATSSGGVARGKVTVVGLFTLWSAGFVVHCALTMKTVSSRDHVSLQFVGWCYFTQIQPRAAAV